MADTGSGVLKRGREEDSNGWEEDSSSEEENVPMVAPKDTSPPQLAPRVVTPQQQVKQEDYEKTQKKRRRVIRELDVLHHTHPDVKVEVNSEFEQKLALLNDEDLVYLREKFHSAISGCDPFVTGRALTNIVGRLGERFFRLPGLSQRVNADTRLIANMERSLPFSPSDYGPQFESASQWLTHAFNIIAECPPATHPNSSNIPAASLSLDKPVVANPPQ